MVQVLSHRDAGPGGLSLPQCHPLLGKSWIKPSTTPSLHIHLLLSPSPVNTKVSVQQFMQQAHPPSSQASPHSTVLIWPPESTAPAPPPFGKSQLSHNQQSRGARCGDTVPPGAHRCWPVLSPPAPAAGCSPRSDSWTEIGKRR